MCRNKHLHALPKGGNWYRCHGGNLSVSFRMTIYVLIVPFFKEFILYDHTCLIKTNKFIITMLVMVKHWKKRKCPSIGDWLNGLWNTLQ